MILTAFKNIKIIAPMTKKETMNHHTIYVIFDRPSKNVAFWT